MSFKLLLIDHKVLFTLPHVVIVLLDDVCGDETHLDEGLDAGLQEVPIYLFTVSILGQLVKYGSTQLLNYLVKALFLKVTECTGGQALHAAVF